MNQLALVALGVALALPWNAVQAAADRPLAKATFAGGCFWCMEPPFDKLEGVVATTSGYIGGDSPNPTYEAYRWEAPVTRKRSRLFSIQRK